MIRQICNLGGLWDFAFLGKIDLDTFDPAGLKPAEKMYVPSAFDALPQHAGQRGAAAYRKVVEIPCGRVSILEFEAASMWCRIYVDGTALGEHACGYVPFSIQIPPSTSHDREIVVLVDNRFDFGRVPMHEEYFDFYQYGGILRDVRLRLLPAEGPSIESVQVTPEKSGYREGTVRVSIRLGGDPPDGATLQIGINASEGQRYPATSNLTELLLHVSDPRLWSPADPHLYTLRATLCDSSQKSIDDLEVTFGLRLAEARDGRLWLNGEELFLRGYNRHEWHPNSGPSTPALQMAADLALLKQLGCNFIRGSHYPQSQTFLSLCDRLGFLVWEENLGWGQSERTFASDRFRRDHLKSLESMVSASFNHPSVIIWGFLNEAATDHESAGPVIEESVMKLRAMDPSRLVTYASNRPLTDKFFHLIDIISLNLYPGWYGCEGEENPLALIPKELRETTEALDSKGWSGKPLLLSEIGAEGLYGWHEAHDDFFSEEYQALYLQEACKAVLGNPRWSGLALWHFSDVRTYSRGWSLRRPRTFNNKGTLDEYRRPKAAFSAVRAAYAHHASKSA